MTAQELDPRGLVAPGGPDTPGARGGLTGAGALGPWLSTLLGPVRELGLRAGRWLSPLRAVTALGWSVLGGSLAAWIVGSEFGWVELCVVAVAGLISLLLSVPFVIGRMALRVELDLGRGRVNDGEDAEIAVRVANLAGRTMLPVALELAVGRADDGVPPARRRREPVPVAGLARGAAARDTRIQLPGVRRGVVEIGPATAVRADPLGLMRRSVSWPQVKELVVHPRTVSLHRLDAGLLRDLDGRAVDQVSSSDLDFHALRDYVRGDDRRHIHWRSSARAASLRPGADRFLIRQYLQTRRTHLLILVDGDPAAYPDPEDFETALSVAASVACRAVEDGIDTSLIAADRSVREVARRGTALDACARARLGAGSGAGASGGLSVLAARGARLAPQASVALLVTGARREYPRLREARTRLRAEVAVSVLQVTADQRPSVTESAGLTVLRLQKLTDLPALVSAGGMR